MFLKSRGLTLVEIVAVLFIAGLMITIASSTLSKAEKGVRVHAASQTVVTMLRATRQLAVSRNAIYILDLDKGSNSATIIDENGDVEGKSFRLPRYTFFANDPANLDDIQYFPSGRAIKQGGGAAINSIWITSERNPSLSDRITVLATTGRVRLRKDQSTP